MKMQYLHAKLASKLVWLSYLTYS